jgi:endonuclease/exonuclease/phosphatase family metal-dependent hydrolase
VPIRIATFNVENLFSRAKVLNLQDSAETADRLLRINDLQKLLDKTAYTPAMKVEILALVDELKGDIEIREDRGKLITGTGANRKVAASGSGDWDGGIDLKRAEFTDIQRENTALVFNTLKADVFCVVEAEGREVLKNFNSALLSPKYKFNVLIDGNDPRGIDVGLYSKFEFGTLRTHIFDGPANSRTFSRDCPEYEVKLPSGKSLFVLPNHFKSKSGGEAATDARRKRQAEAVRDILKRYDLATEFVVVAGDLNDTPDRAPLQPLLGVPNLFDVLAVQFPSAADAPKRGTYKFGNKLPQIDYLLVSKPLRDKLTKAGVEQRGIWKIADVNPAVSTFAEITGPNNAASDHGAVFADFDIG